MWHEISSRSRHLRVGDDCAGADVRRGFAHGGQARGVQDSAAVDAQVPGVVLACAGAWRARLCPAEAARSQQSKRRDGQRIGRRRARRPSAIDAHISDRPGVSPPAGLWERALAMSTASPAGGRFGGWRLLAWPCRGSASCPVLRRGVVPETVLDQLV
jgi:hypothetical protein